jgi:hypothetical protein
MTDNKCGINQSIIDDHREMRKLERDGRKGRRNQKGKREIL